MSLELVSAELLGVNGPSIHYLENFESYEATVLAEAVAHGFPSHLWPHGSAASQNIVRLALLAGSLPTALYTSQPMTHDAYRGPKQHESVLDQFRRSFSMFDKALFVITQGEDWWPYEKSFLAHDAETFMLYCLYERAKFNRAVLPKKSGRQPKRIDPAIAEAKEAKRREQELARQKELEVKAERTVRYQAWLEECKAYRVEVERLKRAYETALLDYSKLKSQGAPKWIP